MDKLDWYTTERLDKIAPIEEYPLRIIMGGRGHGKSTNDRKTACEAYLATGKAVLWLRHKVNEISPNFLASWLAKCKEFGFCPNTWEVHGKAVWDGDKLAVIFATLSTYSTFRDMGLEDTSVIIFDEFVPENDERYGLSISECTTAIMSIAETFLRGRGYMMMTANITDITNPFFVGLGIYPDANQEFTLYPEKGIAIQIVDPKKYRKKREESSAWNKVYKTANYLQDEGTGRFKSLTLVRSVPKHAKLLDNSYYLVVNDVIYAMWHDEADGLLYWDVYKGNLGSLKMRVFTRDEKDVSNIVRLIEPSVKKILKWYMDNGLVRYTTPNVMMAVRSCLDF